MKNDSLICGIDLSLRSSGVCIIDSNNKIVHCESINPTGLSSGDRLNYIYERYYAIFDSYKSIDIVGFERQVSQQRYNWNAKYILDIAEGFGVLKLVLHQISLIRDLDVYHFTAQDLKIYATGNGKATKEEMIDSMPKRSLSKVQSYVIPSAVDDVVDAYYAASRTLSLLNSSDPIEDKYIYSSCIKKGVELDGQSSLC